MHGSGGGDGQAGEDLADDAAPRARHDLTLREALGVSSGNTGRPARAGRVRGPWGPWRAPGGAGGCRPIEPGWRSPRTAAARLTWTSSLSGSSVAASLNAPAFRAAAPPSARRVGPSPATSGGGRESRAAIPPPRPTTRRARTRPGDACRHDRIAAGRVGARARAGADPLRPGGTAQGLALPHREGRRRCRGVRRSAAHLAATEGGLLAGGAPAEPMGDVPGTFGERDPVVGWRGDRFVGRHREAHRDHRPRARGGAAGRAGAPAREARARHIAVGRHRPGDPRRARGAVDFHDAPPISRTSGAVAAAAPSAGDGRRGSRWAVRDASAGRGRVAPVDPGGAEGLVAPVGGRRLLPHRRIRKRAVVDRTRGVRGQRGEPCACGTRERLDVAILRRCDARGGGRPAITRAACAPSVAGPDAPEASAGGRELVCRPGRVRPVGREPQHTAEARARGRGRRSAHRRPRALGATREVHIVGVPSSASGLPCAEVAPGAPRRGRPSTASSEGSSRSGGRPSAWTAPIPARRLAGTRLPRLPRCGRPHRRRVDTARAEAPIAGRRLCTGSGDGAGIPFEAAGSPIGSSRGADGPPRADRDVLGSHGIMSGVPR